MPHFQQIRRVVQNRLRFLSGMGIPTLLFLLVALLAWYGFRQSQQREPLATSQHASARFAFTGAPVTTDASTGFVRTDEDHAFVASSDGATMSSVTLPVVDGIHTDTVYFLSPTLGWASIIHESADASCSVGIYKTAGSQAWITLSTITLSFCANPHVEDIVFHDTAHGWMVITTVQGLTTHEGALFTTSDGGHTWNRLPLPYSGHIVFTTDSVGWLVTSKAPGLYTSLYVTRDGGHTWQVEKLPVPAAYTADLSRIGAPIWWTVNDGALAVSYEDTTNFHATLVLYTTGDGGLTWSVAMHYPVDDLAITSIPMQARSGNTAFVAIGKTLYRSIDGGHTWSSMGSINGLDNAQALHFADAEHGWFVSSDTQCVGSKADQTCTTSSNIHRSQDGGHTWETTLLR